MLTYVLAQTASESDRENFRSHIIYAPSVLQTATLRSGETPRRIVDFRCGQGLMTLGMALAFPRAEVIGIDVHNAFSEAAAFSERALGRPLPSNLSFQRVEPGARVATHVVADLVYSWSVMEHVPRAQLPLVIEDMALCLAPGGRLLTQVCPLFFSPFGSHLGAFSSEPWAHLIHSHADLRERVVGTPDTACPPGSATWMFNQYEGLNKVTAREIVALLGGTRLASVECQLRRTDKLPPPHLMAAYDPESLLTEELFLIHQRESVAVRPVGGDPAQAFRPKKPALVSVR